ncbi:THxN family PEP-CTERM protein [Undibacterium sp. TJN25]|uniref:THxN family PEP-CTERM protein n=1 Tax=Undibacterium sp. TJN25 TaxID=3413056 RepID=UPI003BF3B075
MKKIISAMCMLAGVFYAATASADVIQWSYSESLVWSGQTYGAGGGTQLNTPSSLSWGTTGGSSALGGNRSSLVISPTSSTGTVNTNGAIVPTNTITHTNNPLDGTLATLLSATLTNTLTLTPTNPAGAALPTQTINFAIDFKETPNSTPCGFTSVSVCDDIFVITLGALNQSFVYAGNTYFVSIVNLTNNLLPLPAATCAQAGAAAGCIGFTTQENTATATRFGFEITEQAVTIPEPGELALLAIGLLGLYFVRNRKSIKL